MWIQQKETKAPNDGTRVAIIQDSNLLGEKDQYSNRANKIPEGDNF